MSCGRLQACMSKDCKGIGRACNVLVGDGEYMSFLCDKCINNIKKDSVIWRQNSM